MARYNINNQLGGTPQVLTTTHKTQVIASAATATLTSAKVYEIGIGQDGTLNATDCQVDWDLSRVTALGTGTTVVAVPLDVGPRAAGTVGTVNHTVEPTVTAASSIWNRGINQRGVWQWQAADEGAMIIIPATNLAGVALRAKSTNYVGTAVGELKVME